MQSCCKKAEKLDNNLWDVLLSLCKQFLKRLHGSIYSAFNFSALQHFSAAITRQYIFFVMLFLQHLPQAFSLFNFHSSAATLTLEQERRCALARTAAKEKTNQGVDLSKAKGENCRWWGQSGIAACDFFYSLFIVFCCSAAVMHI